MPTSLLDKIRSALKRSTSTTGQLADALADARKANADAIAAVERQAETVREGFTDAEAKRAADRAALAASRDAAEDAAALLAEVERRHSIALDAEDQERRITLYESARASADEAATELATAYPAIIKSTLKMLRRLAAAQRDVEVANSQLPAGRPAINDPELTVRCTSYRPHEIVSESEVVLWTRHDMVTPLPEPYQSEIEEARDGWGIHRGNAERTSDDEPSYLRVRYLRREVRQPVVGVTPPPLAAALRLPALKGTSMAWGAPEPEFGTSPTLLAVFAGQARPDNVLARLAEMNEAPAARPKLDEPEVRIEWEMLGYVGATPLKPLPYTNYSRGDGVSPQNGEPETLPRAIGSDDIGVLPSASQIAAARAAQQPTRLVQPSGQPTRSGARH